MTPPPFRIHLIEHGGTERHWPMPTWEDTVEWFSRVTEIWPESTASAYAGDEIKLRYYKGKRTER